MTVKITLEYPNVDAAIVALGKLTSAAGTTIVEGKPRKGRSDAGKPRKNTGETPLADPVPKAAAPATQERTDKADTPLPEAAPADAHKAEPSGVVPPKAAASSIATEADAQKALEKLFESFPDSATGISKAKEVLGKFGVARVRDLKEEQRSEFITQATAALPKSQQV